MMLIPLGETTTPDRPDNDLVTKFSYDLDTGDLDAYHEGVDGREYEGNGFTIFPEELPALRDILDRYEAIAWALR